MRNFICSLMAITLSLNLFSQTFKKPTPVQVNFGRYGADCSSGRGTCSFSVSKNGLETILEKGTRKISENSFLLKIERNTLTKQEEVCIAGTIFSEMNPSETVFFVQQDDIALSEDTLQNLGMDKRFNKIAAGSYPMSISNHTVEIIFTLKNPNDVKP